MDQWLAYLRNQSAYLEGAVLKRDLGTLGLIRHGMTCYSQVECSRVRACAGVGRVNFASVGQRASPCRVKRECRRADDTRVVGRCCRETGWQRGCRCEL